MQGANVGALEAMGFGEMLEEGAVQMFHLTVGWEGLVEPMCLSSPSARKDK